MRDKKAILLVEDNSKLNEINRRALERAGYRVVTAASVAEARVCLAQAHPDVILLDIMLPDGDGVDFCGEIRQQTAAPILFLTSVGGYEQTLRGLAAGGDDYLNKPYDLNILVAKVGAFLRRDEIASRVMKKEINPLVRGALMLDPMAASAYANGIDLLLTKKEFAVLLLLAQNEGNAFTADSIYRSIWRQPMGENDAPVKITISRLRKKLKGCGYGIAVRRGEGYCFERSL